MRLLCNYLPLCSQLADKIDKRPDQVVKFMNHFVWWGTIIVVFNKHLFPVNSKPISLS